MNTLLAVAPNGARKTKIDVPSIPLTAKEIGTDAKSCCQAGSSMVHLHVRDAEGKHSLDCDLYRRAIEEVRKQTEDQMFIQVTSEAVGKYSAAEQFEMIYSLKPQGVSIGLREIRALGDSTIKEHFKWMREHGVNPQLILYNQHDLSMYKTWLEENVLIGDAYPLLYVIGKHQPEGVFESEIFESDLTQYASSWMVCAFGSQEYLIGKQATEFGGHVRLGFENNHQMDNGCDAKDNAAIIQQMANYLSLEGKLLASYDDTCKLMKPDW